MYNFMYAGIGTREITKDEEILIGKIAGKLSTMNTLVYSGNAPGTDQAFQRGSNKQNVVFLPWLGFAKEHFDYTMESHAYFDVGQTSEGKESVKKFHPNPSGLSRGGLFLMTRNWHQITGYADFPVVSFVVCCATPKGDGVEGGTGQAVRIANSMGIPVVNIREPAWSMKLTTLTKGLMLS